MILKHAAPESECSVEWTCEWVRKKGTPLLFADGESVLSFLLIHTTDLCFLLQLDQTCNVDSVYSKV